MGLDVKSSRVDRPIRCKYYGHEHVKNGKLTKDAKVKGIFYADDDGAFSTTTISTGHIKRKQETGKIITEDYIPDLYTDDYVMFEDELFLVTDISKAPPSERKVKGDDKWFSRRPTEEFIISLRR